MKLKELLIIFLFAFLVCSHDIFAQPGGPLETPELTTAQSPPSSAVCGSNIGLTYYNPNAGSVTEIYRSTSSNGQFMLIYSAPEGTNEYIDSEVAPRTAYFYKVRAVRDGNSSAFSATDRYESGSDFFTPELTATSEQDGVSVKFTDLSYADISYKIQRYDTVSNQTVVIANIVNSDSGQVYTYKDQAVTPGRSYQYWVDAVISCDGQQELNFVVHKDIVYTPASSSSSLAAPEITPENTLVVCGSNVGLTFYNPNENSSTELYRSTSAGGQYVLIATIPSGTSEYIDSTTAPRTYYFYKARAVQGNVVSGYSDSEQYYSGSDFFNPLLNASSGQNGITLQFTDLSYADYSYKIQRYDSVTQQTIEIATVVNSDSGQVYTYLDSAVVAGRSYQYFVDAIYECDGRAEKNFVVHVDITYNSTSLAAAELTPENPPSSAVCGSNIGLTFYNPNDSSSTEIHRANTAEGPYTLIATVAPGESEYVDSTVAPRSTYYYKVRAIKDGAASEYSQAVSYQSGSDFFNPILSATSEQNGVTVTFRDNSYADIRYTIRRWDEVSNVTIDIATVVNSDSGRVYTYRDTHSLVPGRTYEYWVDAVISCDGQQDMNHVVETQVIYNTSGPAIFSFTLVDPYTDQDAGELREGNTVDAGRKFNIRANTNSLTQSVVFELNGKKTNENQEPYTLFGDNNGGDYYAGKLKPGSYTLKATAYSANNAKGIKGNTLIVHFDVVRTSASRTAIVADQPEVKFDVFPNPVVTESVVEIAGAPDSNVRVDILDQFGTSSRILYQGALDNEGLLSHRIDVANLPKGSYVITVKIEGKTYSKRVLVK